MLRVVSFNEHTHIVLYTQVSQLRVLVNQGYLNRIPLWYVNEEQRFRADVPGYDDQ